MGLRGELQFLSGPNRGRRLDCDERGRFAADDLYAGFALLRISVPDAAPFERELVLHSLQTSTLDIELDRGLHVHGTVHDERGSALAGVRVRLDGSEATTSGDGSFSLVAAASGDPSLIIEQAGFATYRQRMHSLPDDAPIELRPIVLRAGCRLEVEFSGVPAGSGSVQVVVVPTGAQPMALGRFAGPTYPWHAKTPVVVENGRGVVLTDLPRCAVLVRAFHGLAEGSSLEIALDPDRPMRVRLNLRPVPTRCGRVTSAGLPLADARVSLLAANPGKANAVSLGKQAGARLTQGIEALPAARQEVRTDRDGGFQFGWWDTAGSKKILLIEGADGSLLYARELPDRNVEWSLDI